MDVRSFRVLSGESGKDDYYSVSAPPDPYIHAAYRPPMETAVLGHEILEGSRRSVATLSWTWRAVVLPSGGNECVPGKGDSAAAVYVTWKRGLKWYSIKYVWSAGAPKRKTCAVKRNLIRAQDTVIVDSGPPLDEWRTVRIVPDDEFRAHFEGGDPRADVPDLVGIGIMTDGDQTQSASVADYRDFVWVEK
jgi:hypothetical protein